MASSPRIAIVAQGGVFPGIGVPWADPARLWQQVLDGACAARPVPARRWGRDPASLLADNFAVDTVRSLAGCFLDLPQSVGELDPVVTLTLLAGDMAWRGARLERIDRARIGVILGHIALPTDGASRLARSVLGGGAELGVPPRDRHVAGLPAAILREHFGLGGVAYTLDAACASSLYALKLAADELHTGRADAMLAGGVSRPDCLYTQMGFTQLRALSPAGLPRPFDAGADGLVVGEGAGVFVLKRLDDALRAGDTILAVIAGVGLSNDIGGSLLAPNSAGQLRALRAAYDRAGWRPEDVDLIECHATGTPVGDAVEVRSLRTLWGTTGRPGQCVLGSVKSNVGHLLTAAGAAGLVKVLHALASGIMPPTANLETPAAALELTGSPFRVLARPEAWEPREGRPRRAALSGFGFGGINAHVLLEEWTGSALPAPPVLRARGEQRIAVVGIEMRLGLLSERAVPTGRFRIPPRELEEMLAQQRLVLEAAADLLDAVPLAEEVRPGTATFLGVALDLNTTNFTYRWALAERGTMPPLTANRTMGALASIAASRVAREFRLGGPSHTISSEETSGLYALHAAIEALRHGEIAAALVGAVDLPTDVRHLRCLEAEGVTGPPVADAVVVLLLERLDEARKSGRSILAVINEVAPTEFSLAPGWHHRVGAAEGLYRLAETMRGGALTVAGVTLSEPDNSVGASAPARLSPRPALTRQRSCPARTETLIAVAAEDVAGILRELTALRQRTFAPRPIPAEAALALALVARDREEMLELVTEADHWLRERPDEALCPDRIFWSPRPLGRVGQLAFVFPGSGNDYPGMGGAFGPVPVLAADAPVHRRILAQVTLGCHVCAALAAVGVRPDAALGISLGESAALFGLGAWTDIERMQADLEASSLFRDDLCGRYRAARESWGLDEAAPVEWSAGLVPVAAEEVRAALVGMQRAYLLIINGPAECVVGGQREAVAELVRRLGATFVPVPHPTTVHCEVLGAVADAYRQLHRRPTTAPAGVRFYSGGWRRSYAVDENSAAEAILAQALTTLDLPPLVEQAYADGVRLFLEVGPGASASRAIGRILGSRPHRARSLLVAGHDERGTFLRGLALLVAERVPVDLRRLTSPEPAPIEAARSLSEVLSRTVAVEQARAEAHAAYLRQAGHLGEVFAGVLAFEQELLAGARRGANPGDASPGFAPRLDRVQCLTFAVGKIGDVLGPEFAPVDAFPSRVRLPDEPLMLVDRITAIEGEPGVNGVALTSGRVVTEHDIQPGAWYLDAGRIPTCIAVESGQGDLFLSAYLGIDFQTRGRAVYRLLDAVVTFHRSLPGPGKAIRYDIRIERFFRQGETHLFRFHFEGTVDGEPLLTMRDGCAGFFTEEELAAGKGVVQTALERRPLTGKEPDDRIALAPFDGVESYDDERIEALRRGDLEAAFGPTFRGVFAPPPLRLPSGRMRLVHRVERIEPRGGRFGLGLIRGEADIHPDDWFLTCHFIDDQVMPGTLMYECCLHTLRVFLLRLGWVGDGAVACEPVPGVASQLKCRGQVTATTRKVTYEVVLKERGYGLEPYAIVDALMYADGKPIVEIRSMSLRLVGLSEAAVRAIWASGPREGAVSSPASANSPLTGAARRSLYGPERILAFAVGNPSEAFGDPYRIFDAERIIARLPGPPYQFLDRIVAIDAAPWKMVPGGVIEAEYDVPEEAWYFAADRQRVMPFAVLLEVALQPCGWLAAYVGSALTSPVDLSFRNLGGDATLHRVVTPDVGTLTTRVKIAQVSASGGMIIQGFTFAVRAGDVPIYEGTTTFGFFTKAALAQQVGLRDATPLQGGATPLTRCAYPRAAPFPDDRWRMIDDVELSGDTLVRGWATVDPKAWFFRAHFHQDPVWPGSLGLEALLQLFKVAARQRWGLSEGALFHTMAGRHQWVYRGQVLPTNRAVLVQAEITRWEDGNGLGPGRRVVGNGYLTVDGRLIYRMTNFTLDVPHSPGDRAGES